MTGTNAASIDTENSQIHISDGQTIQYQSWFWPQEPCRANCQMRCNSFDGVALLRTVDDARQIKRCLTDGLNGQVIRSAVIVGGGYIGLEIAASLKNADRGASCRNVRTGCLPVSPARPFLPIASNCIKLMAFA